MIFFCHEPNICRTQVTLDPHMEGQCGRGDGFAHALLSQMQVVCVRVLAHHFCAPVLKRPRLGTGTQPQGLGPLLYTFFNFIVLHQENFAKIHKIWNLPDKKKTCTPPPPALPVELNAVGCKGILPHIEILPHLLTPIPHDCLIFADP